MAAFHKNPQNETSYTHLVAVLIANGVFSEEVKLQDVGGDELHVFMLRVHEQK